jgi:bacterioferritin-associated ferredoxin
VHRELYDDLRGFDPHMLSWGVEDLDFGLKCWLMGHPILHDPQALIAHRFRQKFDNFDVPVEMLVHNQLRMARKNFTEGVWRDWVERCRHRNAGSVSTRKGCGRRCGSCSSHEDQVSSPSDHTF